MKKAKIVGCGLSGITSAILLKNLGYDVEIFEFRNHIGGNCYDSNTSGVMLHNYGPHIFHTDDEEVFNFLSRYTEWEPFELKPIGNTYLGKVSLPYSRKTIAQIGRELSPDEIIRYFFRDYSEKQWGVPFEKIPSSIISRIPKTKNCEDPTWFEGQKYQCIPSLGYTYMMSNMLYGLKVHIGVSANEWKKYPADLTVYTGKIDEYFNYCYGELPYRSLVFNHTFTSRKQDTFIINDNTCFNEYTRKYDHSYFTIGHSGSTIITKEYSKNCENGDIPFYPMNFGESVSIYQKYKYLADQQSRVIFLGRLATYKYLDMWMAIKQALLKLNKI
jgi:UDP-galactopyranose mutase